MTNGSSIEARVREVIGEQLGLTDGQRVLLARFGE